jgi:hypothetical protein
LSFHELLLAKGYFPQELPPPFQTRIYGRAVRRSYVSGTLPKEFLTASKNDKAKIAHHNLARVGTLRRSLGIPNPIHHSRLCALIAMHWRNIKGHLAKSPYSLSRPVVNRNGARAIRRVAEFSQLPVHRSRTRSANRFVLRTDISRFYHSIYTHSIPWAIHSKPIAKKSKGKLWGDKIDKVVRDGQDRQTVGIPIGPDTSLVIAELLLAQVDVDLNASTRANGHRYVDDFELAFSTHTLAERALSELEALLNNFELSLNPRKTTTLALPQELDKSWPTMLIRHALPRGGKSKNQVAALIEYFDLAYRLAAANPEDSVLAFAVSRLGYTPLSSPACQSLIQEFICQCFVAEPGTVRAATDALVSLRKKGLKIDRELLKASVNELITINSQIGHASEVAWAVWLAILFDLKLTQKSSKMLQEVDDSVVGILTLHAHSLGLLWGTCHFDLWNSWMTTNSLSDREWLLSYEARKQGWLNSKGGVQHVEKHPGFNWLWEQGVYFYDQRLVGRLRKLMSRLPALTPVEQSQHEGFDNLEYTSSPTILTHLGYF